MRLDRRAHCPKVGKRNRRCRVGEDEIGEVMQFDGGLAGGKHDGLPSLINPGADGLGGDEGCIRGREVAERGPDQRIKSIDYRLHQISSGPTTSTGQPKYEYTKSPLPWRSVNFARSLNRVPTLYKLGFAGTYSGTLAGNGTIQFLYGSFRFAIGHSAFSHRRTSTSRLRFGAFAQVAEPAFSTAEIWTKTSRQSCLPRI